MSIIISTEEGEQISRNFLQLRFLFSFSENLEQSFKTNGIKRNFQSNLLYNLKQFIIITGNATVCCDIMVRPSSRR